MYLSGFSCVCFECLEGCWHVLSLQKGGLPRTLARFVLSYSIIAFLWNSFCVVLFNQRSFRTRFVLSYSISVPLELVFSVVLFNQRCFGTRVVLFNQRSFVIRFVLFDQHSFGIRFLLCNQRSFGTHFVLFNQRSFGTRCGTLAVIFVSDLVVFFCTYHALSSVYHDMLLLLQLMLLHCFLFSNNLLKMRRQINF